MSAPTGLTGDVTAALNRISAALEAIAAALADKGDEPHETQADALVERADDVGVPTAHHITGFRRTP